MQEHIIKFDLEARIMYIKDKKVSLLNGKYTLAKKDVEVPVAATTEAVLPERVGDINSDG